MWRSISRRWTTLTVMTVRVKLKNEHTHLSFIHVCAALDSATEKAFTAFPSLTINANVKMSFCVYLSSYKTILNCLTVPVLLVSLKITLRSGIPHTFLTEAMQL